VETLELHDGRRAFVQQVFDAADPHVVTEAPHEPVIEQQVAYGHERHAVVMCHEGPHYGRSPTGCATRRREVERFVVTVLTEGSQLGETREVAQYAVGIEAQGHQRRVGRDDDLI